MAVNENRSDLGIETSLFKAAHKLRTKANRKSQSDFSCHACGHEIHADVNAARNLESGRSAFDREARHTKA